MATSAVPLHRSRFVSETADEAWDALSRMYTGARPDVASPRARIMFDTAATPDVAADRGYLHSAQGIFDASPGQLNLVSVLRGRISLDFGRHGTVDNLPGDSYVYLPDSPGAKLDWEAFGALAVRLPMGLVAQTASEATGIAPDALRFMSATPQSAAHRRLWWRTATMLWQQLSAPDGLASSPLVHRELLNVAASAAISVFPNTATRGDHVIDPGGVRPSALRRAVAYIDAHASRPISVTDIADAAGTTPRAIRDAFRRHLDTTPTAYLRRVRLEASRVDLQVADPTAGDTVARVAARWGFASPARFSVEFSRAFGQSPGQTLSF